MRNNVIPKLITLNKFISSKHINSPSCRDCKFSIWSLTSKNNKNEHFELKCTKFVAPNKNTYTTINYENACDCRIDTNKCGIEAKLFEPSIVPY
jgi:hypothetical protein